MPKKAPRYTAVFTHPALATDNGSSRREIVKRTRARIALMGGSARVACDGKEFYQCWQSKVSGGVRGHYLDHRKLKDDSCPECHAPLREGATRKKFHVAPKVALGKTCRLCGQLGMAL